MKTYTAPVFLLFSILLFQSLQAQLPNEKQDHLLLNELFEQLSCKSKLPVGQLLTEVGKSFLETPYVAHTLENGKDEKLIINLKEFDCTTFAENCLAITRCLKSEKTAFEDFKKELENIRYRDGDRDGYCSRLHYFSDWVADNIQKGFAEIPQELPLHPFDGKVNFMSKHPNNYEVLKENPELIKLIDQQEKQISAQKLSFLPRAEIDKNEHLLKDGDIVGIATSIQGLDIVHVGLVVTVNNHKHLMHASTSGMKVVISDITLHDFLQQKKHYTGIVIARPIF